MYISKTKVSYPITFDNDQAFIRRSLSIFATENDDNSYISSLLESATEQTEGQIKQDIAYTNNTITFNDFSGDTLVIPQGNFNAITNIINLDTSTLITSYDTVKNYNNFIIEFDSSFDCDSLSLNFTTGWDGETDFPKSLKQAILAMTRYLYDNDEAYLKVWENLCEQYKLL